MKTLFKIKGNYIHLFDKDNLIFGVNRKYYNDKGESIEVKHDYYKDLYDFNDYEEEWYEEWMEYTGLDEQLKSKSTIEPVLDINELFGKYGFVNELGDFVIEPQYAFAYEFTKGLAAVNLKRTWYKTENGDKFYENHFGYINSSGKTIIQFQYDEAYPFNKYGVAVVYDINNGYMLIDMNGVEIQDTRFDYLAHHYDYNDRFIAFSYNERGNDIKVGIYDTKEKRILIEPSFDYVKEINEDCILLCNYKYLNNEPVRYERYINSKGEVLYPWLEKEDFNIIKVPDHNKVTAVAKKYGKEYKYGLYTYNNEYILPMEYEQIDKLTDNLWACYKDGMITVVETELEDLYGRLYTLNKVEEILNLRSTNERDQD